MLVQKSKPIREQVYDRLKEMIVNGEIKQGQRIVEVEYAEKFNTSRTPVREAIRMLELEGFVQVTAKGGVIVTNISRKDVTDIYRIRIALEEIILEEVVKLATEDDIKKMEELLDKTEKMAKTGAEIKNVFKMFTTFNDYLYEISKQERTVELLKNLNSYLKRFRQVAIESEVRKGDAILEHRTIFEAIRDRDLEKAKIINKKHLETSRDFIITRIIED